MNKRAVDAPMIPIIFGIIGVIIIGLGFLPPVTFSNAIGNVIGGVLMILFGAMFLRTSLVGKSRIWSALLAATPFNANGDYLDVGCGNGLVLFKIGQGLTNGHAIGIDIWNSRDQSNNSIEIVKAAIQARGLTEQVAVKTADMRKLPFPDDSFDGVMSSFAIHNVKPAAERRTALREMARVLKPGGKLLIVDMEYKQREYVKALRELGYHDIEVKGAGFNGWWGGPWAPSYQISAVR